MITKFKLLGACVLSGLLFMSCELSGEEKVLAALSIVEIAEPLTVKLQQRKTSRELVIGKQKVTQGGFVIDLLTLDKRGESTVLWSQFQVEGDPRQELPLGDIVHIQKDRVLHFAFSFQGSDSVHTGIVDFASLGAAPPENEGEGNKDGPLQPALKDAPSSLPVIKLPSEKLLHGTSGVTLEDSNGSVRLVVSSKGSDSMTFEYEKESSNWRKQK